MKFTYENISLEKEIGRPTLWHVLTILELRRLRQRQEHHEVQDQPGLNSESQKEKGRKSGRKKGEEGRARKRDGEYEVGRERDEILSTFVYEQSRAGGAACNLVVESLFCMHKALHLIPRATINK